MLHDGLYSLRFQVEIKSYDSVHARPITSYPVFTSLNTTSSISFLTSCIAAGFLTDRGLPSLECLVSCIDMFSQIFLQFEGYMYIAYWVVLIQGISFT